MTVALYDIRVMGHLDAQWSEWFDGLTISNEPSGTTVLCGDIVDQAALHVFFTPGPLLAAVIVMAVTSGRAGLREWARQLTPGQTVASDHAGRVRTVQ
jgi:hypothetical protein